PTSAWCATALPVAVISATSSLTDCNIQIAHRAGADHARAYGMANAFGPKCREEIDRILNRMAAKLDKNVAQHHAGGGARTVRFDTQQHEARATWKPEGGDQLLWEADGLHRESDVAACHPSLREELLDDAPHGDVRYRDWLSTRQPGAVDPDDRAAGVDQRATGESVVNGDVEPDEPVDLDTAPGAPLPRTHAHKSEARRHVGSRPAKRQYDVPCLERVVATQLGGCAGACIIIELEHGEIGAGIAPGEGGRDPASIRKRDRDPFFTSNGMVGSNDHVGTPENATRGNTRARIDRHDGSPGALYGAGEIIG